MKKLSILMTVVFAASTGVAWSQDGQAAPAAVAGQLPPGAQAAGPAAPQLVPYAPVLPNGDFGGGLVAQHHASTAAEGFLRGFADLIRGQGQYNLLSGEARKVHAEARHYEIQNRQDGVEAYFSVREFSGQQRADERGPRPTAEQLHRLASAAKPAELSPRDVDWINGQIAWPGILLADQYRPFRSQLEQGFAERAANGKLGPASSIKADQAADGLIEELKKHVREAPSQRYMAAKRFVESLAQDIQRPAG